LDIITKHPILEHYEEECGGDVRSLRREGIRKFDDD
jgi:hypothetical protein